VQAPVLVRNDSVVPLPAKPAQQALPGEREANAH
jgi:hypothetical protein